LAVTHQLANIEMSDRSPGTGAGTGAALIAFLQ
jgi:hypothetical protein